MAGSPYSGVDPGHPSASGTDAGVSTHSLYIEPDAAPRAGERCEVLQVSPLLHQLLLSACQLPLLYHEDGHDGALIELVLHELKAASPLPMFTPLPQSARWLRYAATSAPAGYSARRNRAAGLNKSARTFIACFASRPAWHFATGASRPA